ncbi:MAG: hypothetical protein GY792_06575, partial [Gammaproteobacteria bacterium]|nr:hypothetical protein [Gammaproteobacteria bacterium]
ITVNNVAPTVKAGADQTITAGEPLAAAAAFTDPGPLDTHTATIAWGDSAVTTGTVDQLAQTISGTHIYASDGEFVVTITVTDDDGGFGTATFSVTVIAPDPLDRIYLPLITR